MATTFAAHMVFACDLVNGDVVRAPSTVIERTAIFAIEVFYLVESAGAYGMEEVCGPLGIPRQAMRGVAHRALDAEKSIFLRVGPLDRCVKGLQFDEMPWLDHRHLL
jgi:hypothetical protein